MIYLSAERDFRAFLLYNLQMIHQIVIIKLEYANS